MKPARVLIGGDESEFNTRTQSEDTATGEFEITIRGLIMEQFVFLSSLDDLRGQVIRAQQETQTCRPLTEIFLLPGKRGRPT